MYNSEEITRGKKQWDVIDGWSKDIISRIQNNDLNFTANDEKMFQGMTGDSNFMYGSMQDFIDLASGADAVKQADELVKELPGYDVGLSPKNKTHKDGKKEGTQARDKNAEMQTKDKTSKGSSYRSPLKRKNGKEAEDIKYSRMDRAGGSEDAGYAQTYESFNQLIDRLLEKKDPSLSILLLEATERFGGRIYTTPKYNFEAGAGRFSNKHPLLLELIHELGLDHKMIKISSSNEYFPIHHEKNEHKDGIKKVIQASKREKRNYLQTISFIDYANQILSKEEVKCILDSFGYYSS
jgi:hypothetical protein